MSDESLVSQLHSLGLRAPASSIEALLTHATKSRLSPIQTLEQLCALCRRERELNNLARRTKDAALGSVPPLDRFDWSHPRSIDQPLYEQLLTLDFLAPGHNVLFRGPAGVGKTRIVAEVVSHELGEKREIFQYRNRKRYRRYRGFRPSYTTLRIQTISA